MTGWEMLSVRRIQKGFYYMGHGDDERGCCDEFFSGLIPEGRGRNGSEVGGISPSHGIYLLTLIAYGVMVVPVFWGEHSKGIPFPVM